MIKTFQFKWIPSIVVIVMLLIMVNLGFWQIRRYHYKQALLEHYHQGLSAKPLDWQTFLASRDKAYHRVKTRGSYLNAKTVLLDNRWHHDQIGYEVLTPFKIKNENKVLLINRGWIPLTGGRQVLPRIKPVLGLQQVAGYINPPPRRGFMLGNNVEDLQHWPLRIQQVNLVDIAKVTGLTLYPYILRLAPSVNHGFVRDWKMVSVKPARHMGYAVQWFAMSLALIIAFLVFSHRKKQRSKDVKHG